MLNISASTPSFYGDICLNSLLPRRKVMIWLALAIISYWTAIYLLPALCWKNKKIEPLKETNEAVCKTQEQAKKILSIAPLFHSEKILDSSLTSPPLIVEKQATPLTEQQQEEIEAEVHHQSKNESVSHDPVADLIETTANEKLSIESKPFLEQEIALSNKVSEAQQEEIQAKQIAKVRAKLAENPDNVSALFNYACLLKQQEHYSEADEFFEKALEKDPENMEILKAYAENLLQQEEHEQAIIPIKKMIALDTTEAFAWGEYGTFLYEDGKHKEAIPCLKKAVELYEEGEGDPYVLLLYAEHLRGLKQFEEAILYFEKILIIKPDALPMFIHVYVHALGELDDYEKAEKVCQSALNTQVNNKNRALFLRTYAFVCQRRKRLEEAQNLYKQSLQLEESANAHFGYGEVLKEWITEKNQEALKTLEKAVKLDPENVTFLASYVESLYDQDLLEKAKEYSQKILILDSNHAFAHKILEEE